MIKKALIFMWTFVKNLAIYTLSVIPASYIDAVKAARAVDQKEFKVPDQPLQPRKRNRRGHRGGRKHHKRHF